MELDAYVFGALQYFEKILRLIVSNVLFKMVHLKEMDIQPQREGVTK